jgi:hypothetical protein
MSQNFSIEIFESCETLPLTTWQRLVPQNSLLSSFEYLRLLENNQQGKMQMLYVFIKEDNLTVGAAYFQLVKFSGAQLNKYTASGTSFLIRMRSAIETQLLKLVEAKLLITGNIFITGDKGVYFDKHVSEADKTRLTASVLHSIMQQRKDASAFLVSDVYEQDTMLDEACKAVRAHRIYEEPDMSLEINSTWNTFDDYLNAFASKYRVRARKVLSQSSIVEKRDMNTEDIAQHAGRIYELHENTMAKAPFVLGQLERDYFAAQKALNPEGYHLFGYFLNGVMIGFNSILRSDSKGEVHYMGMDYTNNKDLNLYNRMLFDMVQFGIEHKLGKLHFGRTATEIKSTVGAIPMEVHGYVKHRNGLVNNYLVKTFAGSLKPKEYQIRSPFK